MVKKISFLKRYEPSQIRPTVKRPVRGVRVSPMYAKVAGSRIRMEGYRERKAEERVLQAATREDVRQRAVYEADKKAKQAMPVWEYRMYDDSSLKGDGWERVRVFRPADYGGSATKAREAGEAYSKALSEDNAYRQIPKGLRQVTQWDIETTPAFEVVRSIEDRRRLSDIRSGAAKKHYAEQALEKMKQGQPLSRTERSAFARSYVGGSDILSGKTPFDVTGTALRFYDPKEGYTARYGLNETRLGELLGFKKIEQYKAPKEPVYRGRQTQPGPTKVGMTQLQADLAVKATSESLYTIPKKEGKTPPVLPKALSVGFGSLLIGVEGKPIKILGGFDAKIFDKKISDIMG